MCKFKYALFDLDGTLTDSKRGIFNSINHALEKMGEEKMGDAELMFAIGPPLGWTFEKLGFSPEDVKKCLDVYHERYDEKGYLENDVYAGVEDMLKELKKSGIILGVATSKPQHLAEKVLSAFKLDQYFDVISGSTPDAMKTSKAWIIRNALEKLHVEDKKDVVMIGDRTYDVDGAKDCGIKCIGAAYGYGGAKELIDCGADFIAETPKEVVNFIV